MSNNWNNALIPDIRRDLFGWRYQLHRVIRDHIHDDILKAKYLELTIDAREEFRVKIALYYGRTPEEDLV